MRPSAFSHCQVCDRSPFWCVLILPNCWGCAQPDLCRTACARPSLPHPHVVWVPDSDLQLLIILFCVGALSADRQLLQASAPGPVGSAGLAPAPTAGRLKTLRTSIFGCYRALIGCQNLDIVTSYCSRPKHVDRNVQSAAQVAASDSDYPTYSRM